MRFDGPPDAPAVTLSFSIWDDCADGLLIGPGFEFTWDCYALDIRVEPPHRFPTADSPESRTPQTSRDTCQRNTSGLPEALVPARQDVSGLSSLFCCCLQSVLTSESLKQRRQRSSGHRRHGINSDASAHEGAHVGAYGRVS